jgi:6-phosphogluconolactonase (cycloisomerase 2 family)
MTLFPSVSRALVLFLALSAGLVACKRKAPAPATGPEPPGLNLYVGCANATGDIRRYRLASDGSLTQRETISAGSPVSFSALHPSGKLLYVNHRSEGKISTFAIGANGVLSALASVPVPVDVGQPRPDAGALPANPATQTLEVDAAGRFLLAPNYDAHTTLVFNLDDKGTVGKLAFWHSAGLKAHHTLISPNGRFVLVPYLGSHIIVTYALDAATGQIDRHSTLTLPGTTPGPRHLALHPNGKWLYSINETNGTVGFFTFDQTEGSLTPIADVPAIQPDYQGALKNSSEVVIAPSGKFLYVSNRLDNQVEGSLGAFAIDQSSGKLTTIGFQGSRGKTPRHFTLTPDGALLVAANQNSANIALFTADPGTGALTFLRQQEVCGTPFFVRIMAP